MNISNEKMSFLTANYGLSPSQITQFQEAYYRVYNQMAGEIEASWHEGGYYPEDEESAMIECLLDADRLSYYIDDYDAWCSPFLMKQELAHDILEVPMPSHLIDYLKSKGLSCWQLV